jgi:hypothetical protein
MANPRTFPLWQAGQTSLLQRAQSEWFLNKSKRDWFQIPSSRMHPESSRIHFHSGLPILHRRTQQPLPPAARVKLRPVVHWGDEVANG